MREAEERRVDQLPYETESGFSADHQPTTSGIRGAHRTPSPSPIENPSGPFTMPVVSQAGFNVLHMPYCSSSEASTSVSEVGNSPAISPFDSGGLFPFPRLPSLEELSLPQPLTGNALGARPCDTEFVIQEGLFHPAAGSALGDTLQGGMSNHTAWSHNWFGYGSFAEQNEGPHAAAEGEEDLKDLSGDPHSHLKPHTYKGLDGRHAPQENVSVDILWSR